MQMRRDRCDVVYFIYYLFIYLSIYFAVVWLVAGLYVHIYLILNKWEHLAAHSLVYRTSSRSVDRIGQPAIKCTLIIHLRHDLFLRPSFFFWQEHSTCVCPSATQIYRCIPQISNSISISIHTFRKYLSSCCVFLESFSISLECTGVRCPRLHRGVDLREARTLEPRLRLKINALARPSGVPWRI